MKSDHQRQTRQGGTDRKVVSRLARTHTGCSINVNLKLQMCSLGSHTLTGSGSQLIPPLVWLNSLTQSPCSHGAGRKLSADSGKIITISARVYLRKSNKHVSSRHKQHLAWPWVLEDFSLTLLWATAVVFAGYESIMQMCLYKTLAHTNGSYFIS